MELSYEYEYGIRVRTCLVLEDGVTYHERPYMYIARAGMPKGLRILQVSPAPVAPYAKIVAHRAAATASDKSGAQVDS